MNKNRILASIVAVVVIVVILAAIVTGRDEKKIDPPMVSNLGNSPAPSVIPVYPCDGDKCP